MKEEDFGSSDKPPLYINFNIFGHSLRLRE